MAGAGWFRRSHSVPEGPERSWPRWLKLAPHGEDVSLGGVSRVVRIPARDAASRGQIIGGLPSSTFFVTSSDNPRRVCCSLALSIVPASLVCGTPYGSFTSIGAFTCDFTKRLVKWATHKAALGFTYGRTAGCSFMLKTCTAPISQLLKSVKTQNARGRRHKELTMPKWRLRNRVAVPPPGCGREAEMRTDLLVTNGAHVL